MVSIGQSVKLSAAADYRLSIVPDKSALPYDIARRVWHWARRCGILWRQLLVGDGSVHPADSGRLIVVAVIAIIIGVLAVIAGAVVVLVVRRRSQAGQTAQTNFRVFFITGLVMLALGIINASLYFAMQVPFYIGLPMVIIGGVYTIIGWTHRSTWRQTGEKAP